MPQSTKDSHGGKTHPEKSSGGHASQPADKSPKNPNSPTGSQNQGEKKTTP